MIKGIYADICISIYLLLTLFFRISIEGALVNSPILSILIGIMMILPIYLFIKYKIFRPSYFGLLKKKENISRSDSKEEPNLFIWLKFGSKSHSIVNGFFHFNCYLTVMEKLRPILSILVLGGLIVFLGPFLSSPSMNKPGLFSIPVSYLMIYLTWIVFIIVCALYIQKIKR